MLRPSAAAGKSALDDASNNNDNNNNTTITRHSEEAQVDNRDASAKQEEKHPDDNCEDDFVPEICFEQSVADHFSSNNDTHNSNRAVIPRALSWRTPRQMTDCWDCLVVSPSGLERACSLSCIDLVRTEHTEGNGSSLDLENEPSNSFPL